MLHLLQVETFDRGRILLGREEGVKQHQCQRDLVSEVVCQIFCRFRVRSSSKETERERKGERCEISSMKWDNFVNWVDM